MVNVCEKADEKSTQIDWAKASYLEMAQRKGLVEFGLKNNADVCTKIDPCYKALRAH